MGEEVEDLDGLPHQHIDHRQRAPIRAGDLGCKWATLVDRDDEGVVVKDVLALEQPSRERVARFPSAGGRNGAAPARWSKPSASHPGLGVGGGSRLGTSPAAGRKVGGSAFKATASRA